MIFVWIIFGLCHVNYFGEALWLVFLWLTEVYDVLYRGLIECEMCLVFRFFFIKINLKFYQCLREIILLRIQPLVDLFIYLFLSKTIS